MDNSLSLYKLRIEQMIDALERFSQALNHYVVAQPRSTLEEAVRCGFPSDIAKTYLQRYYVHNEADANEMIRIIHDQAIPYLKKVAFYIGEATELGGGVSYERNIDSLGTLSTNSDGYIPTETLAYCTYRLIQKDDALHKNNRDLEKALGIKQDPPMSIAEADKQNANPHFAYKFIFDDQGDYYWYKEDAYLRRDLPPLALMKIDELPRCRKNPNYQIQYSVNCATCAAAYVLRLRGFDVKAKGNPEEEGNLNTWLSNCHSFDIWSNVDGTPVTPTLYRDWMKSHNLESMSSYDYKAFFDEKCKEPGVYIVTLAWKNGVDGHATILQRDEEGLHYIEPQVYDPTVTDDGRRSIDDIVFDMAAIQPAEKGIMRVDDKLFKTEFANLFEI